MYTINKGRLPILSWIPPHEIESGAIDQATNAANHPHARQRIVLLPDVHQGYGVPIGCVVAFDENHISPAAVGYDIGCGMVAVRSSIEVDELDHHTLTKGIMSGIRERIPLGEGGRRADPYRVSLPEVLSDSPIVQQHLSSAPLQLGTLGGGK